MDILLIGEASGVHHNLKKGLLELGHNVDHKILYGSAQGRANDGSFASEGKGIIGGIKRNISPLITANSLKQYDVINFINTITAVHGQYTKYLDLPILNRKAKKLSYYALSCDELGLIRRSTHDLKYSPCATCLSSGETLGVDCEKRFNPIYDKSVDRAEKYLNVGASSMIEYDHVSEVFKNKSFTRIPLPIDTETIEFHPAVKSEKILIAHAPTRRGFKGTDVVLKAIEVLKAQRNDFEFIIVEKLSFKDYVKVMTEVDIVIDQVYSQSPGMNALEMLAAGKIVLTGATELGKSYFDFMQHFPGFDASPEAIKLANKLGEILDNQDMFAQWSESGRKYIINNHSCVTVAKQFVDLWS